MEHIVQFAISVDDERIKQLVEANAVNIVLNDLKQEVVSHIISKYGGLKPGAEKIVKDIVVDYREEIIDNAVDIVCRSIKCSKKYREALEQVEGELLQSDGMTEELLDE